MRLASCLIVLVLLASYAGADEFTDCMEQALAQYKRGDFIDAQKWLERAAEMLEPKATAQIPPTTVKDLTYTNYEQRFQVSAPNKDWRIQALKSKPTPGALRVLVTMSIGPVKQGEIAIFYMRDLREAFGAQAQTIAGNEMLLLRDYARKASLLVGNLTDCSKGSHTELALRAKPAISTEFTGKRKTDAKPMHARVLQVLVGEKVFTGIFISTEGNWETRSKDFDHIISTISFDVPMPKPILMPPDLPAGKAGRTE